MSKYTEAETKIKKIMCEEIRRLPSHFDGEDEVYDSTKDVDEILKLNKAVCKALQIADRVSQIDYMEMPTPKIIETDNGVKANANILEAVEVITHNNLLAKIKGEEERIYAK